MCGDCAPREVSDTSPSFPPCISILLLTHPLPFLVPSFFQIETVATTLALAEQNNARELKRVCLEFVSKHLQAVMGSEGYQYMVQTCPQLQAELLQVRF